MDWPSVSLQKRPLKHSGGALSHPAAKLPALFPRGSLFDRYPYALPTVLNRAYVYISLTSHCRVIN